MWCYTRFSSARDPKPQPICADLETFLRTFETFPLRTDLVAKARAAQRAAVVGRGRWGGLYQKIAGTSGADAALAKTRERIWAETKGSLPAWSPASYPEGTEARSSGAVLAVSALVLDVDEDCDLRRLWGLFPGVARALHTSASSTDARPKARLIVPVDKPIEAASWPDVWGWLDFRAREFGIVPDGKCKDPSRIYFLPAVFGQDRHRIAWTETASPVLRLPPAVIEAPAVAVSLPPERTYCSRGAAVGPRRTGRTEIGHFDDRDPQFRERAAEQLGGVIRGGVVRFARCPSCQRPELWWHLRPTQGGWGARCNRENSCGFSGFLSSILTDEGRT